MNLQKHYDNLYNNSIRKIRADEYTIDNLIDYPEDRRRGITLLARPSAAVKKKISVFLEEMKRIDPRQYYYPPSDLHITVLSVISCNDGFSISGVNIDEYIAVINEALSRLKSFTIDFRGITASPSCFMIQGFPQNDTLDILREKLRISFSRSTLEHSIDIRYEIKTAHSTVIRLRNELTGKKEYLRTLESYRHFDFGSFEVSDLELVVNDWYLRKENTEKLSGFHL